MSHSDGTPLVVLDDDPTGVQTLAGIRVLLAWSETRIGVALERRSAVHLITNSRALSPKLVQPLIEDAARVARSAVHDARIVLRGDSTLRGHMREEYLGVREVVAPGTWPVLLLVPALPTADRVTIGGVHYVVRDDVRTPLDCTEYAFDGVFAYTTARLLDWAEERSDGLFRADAGRELHLEELRSDRGAAAVTDALVGLCAAGAPAAFVPDAETLADLEIIATGLRGALDRGTEVIVRCAPTFAGVLGATAASDFVGMPRAGPGALVVCGSYVPQTTRQLLRLVEQYPWSLVEADVTALCGDDPSDEITRLARETSATLDAKPVAVISTPRSRPEGTETLDAGERIAAHLASVVGAIEPRPSVVIAKGGITSAVTLRDGVGAVEADVLGPVEPGVSRWATTWLDGTPLDYVVVPGNVGDDDLLLRLVDAAVRGSPA